MFKLLVTLVAFLILALALFGLRQNRREIERQTSLLHEQIHLREETLRGQRPEIAHLTNPLALAVNLKQQGMNAGDAMQPRESRTSRRTAATSGGTPRVETDLLAPLRDSGSGHSNPNRPHD